MNRFKNISTYEFTDFYMDNAKISSILSNDIYLNTGDTHNLNAKDRIFLYEATAEMLSIFYNLIYEDSDRPVGVKSFSNITYGSFFEKNDILSTLDNISGLLQDINLLYFEQWILYDLNIKPLDLYLSPSNIHSDELFNYLEDTYGPDIACSRQNLSARIASTRSNLKYAFATAFDCISASYFTLSSMCRLLIPACLIRRNIATDTSKYETTAKGSFSISIDIVEKNGQVKSNQQIYNKSFSNYTPVQDIWSDILKNEYITGQVQEYSDIEDSSRGNQEFPVLRYSSEYYIGDRLRLEDDAVSDLKIASFYRSFNGFHRYGDYQFIEMNEGAYTAHSECEIVEQPKYSDVRVRLEFGNRYDVIDSISCFVVAHTRYCYRRLKDITQPGSVDGYSLEDIYIDLNTNAKNNVWSMLYVPMLKNGNNWECQLSGMAQDLLKNFKNTLGEDICPGGEMPHVKSRYDLGQTWESWIANHPESELDEDTYNEYLRRDRLRESYEIDVYFNVVGFYIRFIDFKNVNN